MRRIIVGGIAAATGVALAMAPWASAGGNGAQKSGLAPASGSMTNCQENDGSQVNGWAILNAPGQPGGAVQFLNGEVHLIGATPDTTYQIDIGVPSGGGNNGCMATMDSVTTNTEGIGNGHINIPGGMPGSYFIALFDQTNMNEQFATGPMTVS